ncbi:hypothetical protein [Cellulomonas triticagri]|uniref:Uncharacterized protein n=1 Tax=Cellulomonas triticagri TaxID=2483352 RepID=A0A3M2IUH1_9CELL|nr:hypothetical protein [Cellulomonas triticagri]RMI03330.1 hypothetical protein EBM89_19825 [Cellulomonas triticagri]
MTEHRPNPGADDDLARRVAAALRDREPSADTTQAAADRIADRLAAAQTQARVVPLARRVGTVAAAGVVTSTVVVLGAGAAAAANPYSGFAVAVENVAHAVGVDWSAMPEGYTRDQYTAFWDAGYTVGDVQALEDLWQVDATTAKAQAGQLLLDGADVPVAPGSAQQTPEPVDTSDPLTAYFDSGYSLAEAEQLADLWQVDLGEAKVRAGQMIVDGEQPPVPAP